MQQPRAGTLSENDSSLFPFTHITHPIRFHDESRVGKGAKCWILKKLSASESSPVLYKVRFTDGTIQYVRGGDLESEGDQ